jgi:hypothetical protein
MMRHGDEEQCECGVGLTRDEVAVLKSDHSQLLFTVYGRRPDGTFTEERGLVGMVERREAQWGMLKWILTSSILTGIISLLSLLRH